MAVRPRALALSFVFLAACGGDDFSSTGTEPDGGGGSSTGGAAGSPSDGGSTGGSVSVSDAATGSGGATVSVEAAVPCETASSCATGEYCHDDGVCRACSDFSQFRFSDPEEVTALNVDNDGTHMLRETVNPDGFVYHRGDFVNQRTIWWTASLDDPGAPLQGVDLGGGAAVFAPLSGNGPLSGLNFFFDRTVEDNILSNRVLVGGVLGPGGTVTDVADLPAPFNLPAPNPSSSYYVAIAAEAGRLWWLGHRGSLLNAGVYTAPADANASYTPMALNVTTAPANCPAAGEGTPWMHPNGRFGLLSANERFGDCAQSNPTNDLYMLQVLETGHPAGPAQPLAALNLQSVDDVEPSLSADFCWLYFSSRRSGAAHVQAYRARRE